MTFLENLFYGLISGVTEFLPVSSKAHQAILRLIFGVEQKLAVQELFIHIGALLALLVASRESVIRLYREQKAISFRHRRRGKIANHIAYYDLRLLKTACGPLILGLLIYFVTAKYEADLLALMLFVSMNGIALLVAEHTRRGNRDARAMSGLDGIAIGLVGATSVLPGISRTGMVSTYATVRGAEGKSVTDWVLMLSIPALLFYVVYDIIGIVGSALGPMTAAMYFSCLFSGCAAFCGGYIGIFVLRLVLANSSFSKFSYYCFGIAILIFLLYLFV